MFIKSECFLKSKHCLIKSLECYYLYLNKLKILLRSSTRIVTFTLRKSVSLRLYYDYNILIIMIIEEIYDLQFVKSFKVLKCVERLTYQFDIFAK